MWYKSEEAETRRFGGVGDSSVCWVATWNPRGCVLMLHDSDWGPTAREGLFVEVQKTTLMITAALEGISEFACLALDPAESFALAHRSFSR